MRALSIVAGVTPTKICDGGLRKFAHIYNNSDVTIYIGYDGLASTVTTANGYPLLPTGTLVLDNLGSGQVYVDPIYAIHGDVADKEVRVVGV